MRYASGPRSPATSGSTRSRSAAAAPAATGAAPSRWPHPVPAAASARPSRCPDRRRGAARARTRSGARPRRDVRPGVRGSGPCVSPSRLRARIASCATLVPQGARRADPNAPCGHGKDPRTRCGAPGVSVLRRRRAGGRTTCPCRPCPCPHRGPWTRRSPCTWGRPGTSSGPGPVPRPCRRARRRGPVERARHDLVLLDVVGEALVVAVTVRHLRRRLYEGPRASPALGLKSAHGTQGT